MPLPLLAKLPGSGEADEQLEKLVKEAEQGDLWDNQVVGILVKLAAVAAISAVVATFVFIGQPMVQNTLDSFPQR